jgi:hypothetical protein
MVVEIRAALLHHEVGVDLPGHRCEPRLLFTCVCCRRQFAYCTASDAAIALSLDRRWRCGDCTEAAA